MDLAMKTVSRNTHFVWRVVKGEAILMSPHGDRLHALNEVGTFIWELADGSRENLKLGLTDEQCKTLLRKQWGYEKIQKALANKPPISLDELKQKIICPAGNTSFNISAYGDVYPCVYLRTHAGNLRETSFSDAWNSPVMQELRSARFGDLHKCPTCELAEVWCTFCPGHAWLEHGDWLEPSSEMCRVARIRREVYGKEYIFPVNHKSSAYSFAVAGQSICRSEE